jgi:hypothetical protein
MANARHFRYDEEGDDFVGLLSPALSSETEERVILFGWAYPGWRSFLACPYMFHPFRILEWVRQGGGEFQI